MSIHQNTHLTVPSELQYNMGLSSNEIIQSKMTNKFRPLSDAVSWQSGSQITFRLSSNNQCLDTSSVQLHFTLTSDQKDGVGASQGVGDMVMDSHASSLIRTLQIKFGSGYMSERIDRYNTLHGILESTVNDNYQNSIGVAEGYSRRTDRWNDQLASDGAGGLELKGYEGAGFLNTELISIDAKEQGASVQYTIRLDISGMFSMEKLMYLPMLGSLDIELQLEDPRNCFSGYTGTNVPWYQVDNPYITATLVNTSPTYSSALTTALQGGLPLEMDTWNTFSQALSTNTYQSLRIFKKFSSLKTVFVVFQQDYADPKAVRDKTKRFPLLGLNSYQALVDGRPVASHIIETAPSRNSEAFFELLKAFRYMGDVSHSSRLSPESFGTDKFILAIDMEHSHGLLSGTPVSNELTINLQFDSDPTAAGAVTALCMLHYDRRLIVNPGQQFVDLS